MVHNKNYTKYNGNAPINFFLYCPNVGYCAWLRAIQRRIIKINISLTK